MVHTGACRLEQQRFAVVRLCGGFLSLSHQFLWIALSAMGLPRFVIRCVQALYVKNAHWLRFGGGYCKSMDIYSGVKQGCPLSPLLFVIATDPSIRALCSAVGPKCMLRGFADDIALGLSSIWKQAPYVAVLFLMFEDISGLALSPTKCILIPLWPGEFGNIKALLREHMPSWACFLVAGCGKYLGK